MKIKASILLLGASTLFNSCENKPELLSGISKENMNLKAKPGDNFEEYVNGSWLKKNKIPADKSSYGVFDMLLDKSQKDVKAIIEEASKGSFSEGSDEQKIGDYYSSYTNRKDRDAKGVTPIQSELKAIDAISNHTDLASYFGKANRTGVSIPFSVAVLEDFKETVKRAESITRDEIMREAKSMTFFMRCCFPTNVARFAHRSILKTKKPHSLAGLLGLN